MAGVRVVSDYGLLNDECSAGKPGFGTKAASVAGTSRIRDENGDEKPAEMAAPRRSRLDVATASVMKPKHFIQGSCYPFPRTAREAGGTAVQAIRGRES
jgi:hypothetical protein